MPFPRRRFRRAVGGFQGIKGSKDFLRTFHTLILRAGEGSVVYLLLLDCFRLFSKPKCRGISPQGTLYAGQPDVQFRVVALELSQDDVRVVAIRLVPKVLQGYGPVLRKHLQHLYRRYSQVKNAGRL